MMNKLFSAFYGILPSVIIVGKTDIIKTIIISAIAGIVAYFVKIFLDFIVLKIKRIKILKKLKLK